MLATVFALAALLAFTGLWRISEHPVRQTLRFSGALALWATCIVLIITWS